MPASPHKAGFAELLTKALGGIAVLDQQQRRQLEAHYELLVRWNSKMNLTSIQSMEEAVVRHYAESIFLGALLPAHARSVLDVGSGGGFPGLPIAVLHPAWKITLAESNHRKAVFLREAVREMPNVAVAAERAEDLTGGWDLVVSRAVRPLDVCRIAVRVGRGIGLLIGVGDVEALPSDLTWEPPVPLPWGDRRIAVIGSVPRGT